jgi:hypothetical protein
LYPLRGEIYIFFKNHFFLLFVCNEGVVVFRFEWSI